MDIINLVTNFRNAIERAQKDGRFDKDFSFNHFPQGCCGDTSDLLAQYLLDNYIKTWYVCGTYYFVGESDEEWKGMQSHAWLSTKNPKSSKNYIIIDITGDQFKDNPEFMCFDQKIYIGKESGFHKLFDIENRDIRESTDLVNLGFAAERLCVLYKIILRYIE